MEPTKAQAAETPPHIFSRSRNEVINVAIRRAENGYLVTVPGGTSKPDRIWIAKDGVQVEAIARDAISAQIHEALEKME